MPSALKSALRDAVNTVVGVAPWMLTVTCPSNWLRPTLSVVGEVDGVDPFPEPVLGALRRLIPADVVSYGELDRERPGWRAGVRWQGVPRADVTPDICEAHLRFTYQKPLSPWAPAAGRAAR